MSKRIVVAVDGPAGSGKSSVSKQVATDLGLTYVDSGALYRALTWFFLQRYTELNNSIDFGSGLAGLEIAQSFAGDGTSRTSVNGRDVSVEIRNEIIAKNIGAVSDNVQVRHFVNNQLRKWAMHDSLIMDGRDIGSVVFPDAQLKFFLDASVEIRAARRMKEYREMGKNVDEILIKNQIILRDQQDRTRSFGALVQAPDAIYIDTSTMSREAVVEKLKETIREYRRQTTP